MFICIPICCPRRLERHDQAYVVRKPDGSVQLTLTPPAPTGYDITICRTRLVVYVILLLFIISITAIFTVLKFQNYINTEPQDMSVSDGNQICTIGMVNIGSSCSFTLNFGYQSRNRWSCVKYQCLDDYHSDDYHSGDTVECIESQCQIVRKLTASNNRSQYKASYITFIVCIIMSSLLFITLIAVCIRSKCRNKRNEPKGGSLMEISREEREEYDGYNECDTTERMAIGTFCFVDCDSVYGVISRYLPNEYYQIIDLFEHRKRRASKTSLTKIEDPRILRLAQKQYEIYLRRNNWA